MFVHFFIILNHGIFFIIMHILHICAHIWQLLCEFVSVLKKDGENFKTGEFLPWLTLFCGIFRLSASSKYKQYAKGQIHRWLRRSGLRNSTKSLRSTRWTRHVRNCVLDGSSDWLLGARPLWGWGLLTGRRPKELHSTCHSWRTRQFELCW